MFIALATAVPCLALGQTKSDTTQEEVLGLEKEFSEAIVKNDADAVGRFLADDWWLVCDVFGRACKAYIVSSRASSSSMLSPAT
jgi:hypothetical protein